MLGTMFLEYLGKKSVEKQNRKIKKRLDLKLYVECTEFLKNKIDYYKNNNFKKGTYESISWIKYYKHYTNCDSIMQSKIDKLAIELISMTFLQSDIYKIYNSKLNLSVAIKKMLMEKENDLYLMQRQKENEAKLINAERLSSINQYKLNMAIEKENQISKLNKLEQIKMKELSDEQLLKINMDGIPTISELNMQGILDNKFSATDKVNCNVYMKIYNYYYVVTSCPARGRLNGSSFKFERFLTREEAIEKSEILFNQEIDYQRSYIKDQQESIKKEIEKREKVDVDISNVRKVMGLDDNQIDLNGDIF